MTKPPTVIEHTPPEFIELSHIDRLRKAGAEADAGQWGEDLSDLTPQQMVALLSAKE